MPILLKKLKTVLSHVAWEVIYVDDHSPDGTADAIRELARTDRRVRVIERIGRRGLTSAPRVSQTSPIASYFWGITPGALINVALCQSADASRPHLVSCGEQGLGSVRLELCS